YERAFGGGPKTGAVLDSFSNAPIICASAILGRAGRASMEHDDGRVGRLLSRRKALALLGATGGALFTGSLVGEAQQEITGVVSPSCVVRPEQEEGPYFLDERLNRSD